jgi:hypothetical protein
MGPIKNFINYFSKNNIAENKNNSAENKNTKFTDLTESEILIFDRSPTETQFNEQFELPADSRRTKSISILASFKAMVSHAFNTILSVFHGKSQLDILTTNIKAPIIQNSHALNEKYENESIATKLNIIVPSEKKKEGISGDLDVNDFEIIKKDIDDFNMNIKEEDQSIFKEKDEITKDTNSLKNAKAFLEWYENHVDLSSADLNSAPADVIKYAHSLVNKHADTSEKQFNFMPEVKKNFEAAKKLSDYSKSKSYKELQNISLEISDLSDGMLNEMKKELFSEVKIEMSIKDEYLNDAKDSYLDKKNIEIKEKEEEKIKKEKEKLKKEEYLKRLSPFAAGIQSFMSLRLEQSESLYLILKPNLELKEFQKVILEAKNYFSNISEYKPITEIQRNAALSIATNWNTFKAKSQSANANSEESSIFSQIGQIFSRDPLAELKAFPNFEQLDSLLNMEKISNDFK